MTTGITVRRLRTQDAAQRLLASLEGFEPDTLLLCSSLVDPGIGRDVRVWVATDDDRRLVGALVLLRRVRGYWVAAPWTVDDEAARALAPLVEASPATRVLGPGPQLQRLLGEVPRHRVTFTMTWYAVPAPLPVPDELPADDRVRMATLDDLDDLVTLYRDYEHVPVPTVRRLRAYLRWMVANDRVQVTVEDGRLVGAAWIEAQSRHWAHWSGASRPPADRGRGLLWTGLGGGLRETAARGLGGSVVLNPTNPVKEGKVLELFDTPEGRRWAWMLLREQRRFPGHRRVRRIVERLEGAPTTPRSGELHRTDVERIG